MLHNEIKTFDQETIDSTSAFLVGELEALDRSEKNGPLAEFTFTRDFFLREDVTMAQDNHSYIVTAFTAGGGISTRGANFGSKGSNAIPTVNPSYGKKIHNLTPWKGLIAYSMMELWSSEAAGRPIDADQYENVQFNWQNDCDHVAYYGDPDVAIEGLYTSSLLAPTNFLAGASGFTQWQFKTADEILLDSALLQNLAYEQSGWTVTPNVMLIPPMQFAIIAQMKVGIAGSTSLAAYMEEYSLAKGKRQGMMELRDCKWGVGTGLGGTPMVSGTVDRAICMNNDKKRIQFCKTQNQRLAPSLVEDELKSAVLGKIGRLELRYPQVVSAGDGL